MSIEQAEQLKREYTDKWVVVDPGVPELKRFVGLTGKVKTVNMNCRALVEFDGPANIGWFDIDTRSLTVVDEPLPKQKPAAAEAKKPAEKKKKAASGGASPLDLIRKGSAGGSAKKPAGGKAEGGASPLDLIRKQGAARPAAAADDDDAKKAASAEDAAPTASDADRSDSSEASGESKSAADDSGLSPIELIRKQGAAKR